MYDDQIWLITALTFPQEDDPRYRANMLQISIAAAEDDSHLDPPSVREQALLDTGAERCCISYDLAFRIQATIRDDDGELRTAGDEVLYHRGRAKLLVKWIDHNGKKQQRHRYFYVIPGFDVGIVLATDFVTKYDLLGLAKPAENPATTRIAPIKFFKPDKTTRREHDEFTEQQKDKNRQRDKGAQDARVRDIEQRLARTTMAPAPNTGQGTR